MSNKLEYNIVSKFLDIHGGVDSVIEKISNLGVSQEAAQEVESYLNKHVLSNPTVDTSIVENKENIIIMFEERGYVDDYDNPLDPEMDYLTLKKFKNSVERDKYVEENSSKNFSLVDRYSHGASHYSLANTVNYPDPAWDVAYGCCAIEFGDDVKVYRKSLNKKYGKEEGNEKFEKHVNEILDNYSNYENGYSYSLTQAVINKTSNEVDFLNLGTYFNEKSIKNDAAYHAFCNLTEDLSEEIKNQVTSSKNITPEALKGFSNNIMKKDALEMEIVKHTNIDGIESKMLLVSFPEKVVAYFSSHSESRNELEDKTERLVKDYSSLQREQEYFKSAFVRDMVFTSFQEETLRNEVIPENYLIGNKPKI